MTTRTRWWRRLQRPWITAALLALLIADAWWVLHAPTYDRESGAALQFMRLESRLSGKGTQRTSRYLQSSLRADALWFRFRGLFLVRDSAPGNDTRLTLVHQDHASWDELSRLATSEPHRVAQIEGSYEVRRTGLWALTREHHTDIVHLRPWEPSSFDDVPISDVRSLMARTLTGEAGLWRWPGAATGPADQSSSRPLPWGYAHNAAAVLTLAAFVVSLGWAPRVPAAYRARRGRRRLARGLCPRCRYHLAGLETDRCPECGEQWGGSERETGAPHAAPPSHDRAPTSV